MFCRPLKTGLNGMNFKSVFAEDPKNCLLDMCLKTRFVINYNHMQFGVILSYTYFDVMPTTCGFLLYLKNIFSISFVAFLQGQTSIFRILFLSFFRMMYFRQESVFGLSD